MEIRRVVKDKKNFLDLLLLGDEQEDMIDRYLARGDVFAVYDGELRGVCVVTGEGRDVCELKNIAVYKQYERQGYGRTLIEYVCNYYRGRYHTMYVGTGDSVITIPFYKSCGFRYSHRVRNFFTDNYSHPMFEDGRQLIDMIYLKKEL